MVRKTAWERALELGSEEVEHEHRLQLDLFDSLEQALADGAAAMAPAEVLDRLVAYCDVHFGGEELLMRLRSYPRYGAHLEEHRRAMEALEDLRARHGRGEDVLERVRGLRRALAGHIEGMDRDFLQEVGAGGSGVVGKA
jgi:hemerythrin